MASSEETLDVSNPVEVIEGSISRDSPSGTHNDGVQPASTILSDDTESLTGEEQTNFSEWNNVDSDSELILTHLPDIVLVHMMEYLDLRARYYLSRTCRLFYDLFSHPQLWQIAQISLLTQGERRGRNPYHWKLQAVMHHTMAMIVHKFSHLFQHLSLELLQYIQPFDNDSKMLLQHLARECRLESLSIKLGPLTSSDRDISHISSRLSNYQDLHLVVSLVQNASRLKRLSLISWPFFESTNDNKDIFKALITNQKLISLESFNFFFPELKNSQWTDRIPKLPSPELTIRVVSQLKNITQLALRSPMLSDELVLQLAKKKVPLLTFKILIMYSRDSVLMKGFKVPEISSKAWNALRKSSPELAVEYYVFNRVPQEQLGLMLQPEVQLASINILTFGRCDKELVTVLAERYSRTLRQFVSLCDSPNCEEALINLVRSCDLTHLIYYGDISFKAVEKIATVVKDYGQEIESFEFKEKNITTEEENDDEDLVVAKDGESNEYYLTSLKSWHVDATERSKRIDAMSEHVSKCLGFHWRPLT